MEESRSFLERTGRQEKDRRLRNNAAFQKSRRRLNELWNAVSDSHHIFQLILESIFAAQTVISAELSREEARWLRLLAGTNRSTLSALQELVRIPEGIDEPTTLKARRQAMIWYDNLSRLGTLARDQTATLTSRLQDPDMFVRWSSLRALQWLAPNVQGSTVGVIVEVLNTEREAHVADQALTTLSTVSRLQRALVKKWQEEGDCRAPGLQSVVDCYLPVLESRAIRGRFKDTYHKHTYKQLVKRPKC